MAAMFSQNPLMNGPNYSFNDAPKNIAAGENDHNFTALDIMWTG